MYKHPFIKGLELKHSFWLFQFDFLLFSLNLQSHFSSSEKYIMLWRSDYEILKYIEYKNVGFLNIITVLITHEYKSVIYCKEYIIKSTFTWTYTSSKIYIYIQIQRINNVHVCDQTEMYMTPYIQYIQKINQDLVNPEKHSPGIWNDMQV